MVANGAVLFCKLLPEVVSSVGSAGEKIDRCIGNIVPFSADFGQDVGKAIGAPIKRRESSAAGSACFANGCDGGVRGNPYECPPIGEASNVTIKGCRDLVPNSG